MPEFRVTCDGDTSVDTLKATLKTKNVAVADNPDLRASDGDNNVLEVTLKAPNRAAVERLTDIIGIIEIQPL